VRCVGIRPRLFHTKTDTPSCMRIDTQLISRHHGLLRSHTVRRILSCLATDAGFSGRILRLRTDNRDVKDKHAKACATDFVASRRRTHHEFPSQLPLLFDSLSRIHRLRPRWFVGNCHRRSNEPSFR
jgi:hypothetical protein